MQGDTLSKQALTVVSQPELCVAPCVLPGCVVRAGMSSRLTPGRMCPSPMRLHWHRLSAKHPSLWLYVPALPWTTGTITRVGACAA